MKLKVAVAWFEEQREEQYANLAWCVSDKILCYMIPSQIDGLFCSGWELY